MRLNWKGNQKRGEDTSKATVLEIDNGLRVSIHKIVGCGNSIYLSCYTLNIKGENLGTESWEEAEKRAVQIVQRKAKEIYDLAMRLSE